MIGADALVLHLNPLQECLQDGGNTDFSGLLPKIEAVCSRLSVPVIVKEVGSGISPEIARRLASAGVFAIDIAGSGGTSMALVEAGSVSAAGDRSLARAFSSWGMPTAHLLARFGKAFDLPIIASGGVRSGVDLAKCLAMGALLAGIGLPFLRAASQGVEHVRDLIEQIARELKIAMLCTGSKDIRTLRSARLFPDRMNSRAYRAGLNV